MKNTVRCPACATEFPESKVMDLKACPTCRSTQQPHEISEDVLVPLNWADYRILAGWASEYVMENFGENEDFVIELRTILDKISRHRPTNSEPLTLEESVEELEKAGFFEEPPKSPVAAQAKLTKEYVN